MFGMDTVVFRGHCTHICREGRKRRVVVQGGGRQAKLNSPVVKREVPSHNLYSDFRMKCVFSLLQPWTLADIR